MPGFFRAPAYFQPGLAASMGSPLGALLVLVALKTLIDLGAHWLEHKKFSRKAHA